MLRVGLEPTNLWYIRPMRYQLRQRSYFVTILWYTNPTLFYKPPNAIKAAITATIAPQQQHALTVRVRMGRFRPLLPTPRPTYSHVRTPRLVRLKCHVTVETTRPT